MKPLMPTPWKHSNGTYYLNKRVPKDLVSVLGTQKLISLKTKDKKEAEKRICREWLKLQKVFDEERAKLKDKEPLREDHIKQLAALYYSELLEEDDEFRFEEGRDPKSFAKAEESVFWVEDEAREALAKADADYLTFEVEDWLLAHGYKVDKETQVFKRASVEFLKQYVRYLEAISQRNKGQVVDTPSVDAPTKVVRLSKVIEDYLQGKPDTPMVRKTRAVLAKLEEVVSDKGIKDLRQADLLNFFRLAQRLPSERGGKKRPRGVLLKDMVLDEVQMAPATFENNYISPVRLFLKWAITHYQDQGFPTALTTEGIAYEGSKKEGENKQRAMTLEELQRLFEGEEMKAFAEAPESLHCYWLPMLGLYTGARINELCQINPQVDISEKHGAWCFELTMDSEGDERIQKSVKTKKTRLVPIHPQLLKLGFLDYVEAIKDQGHKIIFPQFGVKVQKASGYAREWFTELLRKTGLRDESQGANLLGFHAFRHTLITYAANHTDPSLEGEIGLITGHSRRDQGISSVQQGYVSAREVKKLANVIDKLDFTSGQQSVKLSFFRPVSLGTGTL